MILKPATNASSLPSVVVAITHQVIWKAVNQPRRFVRSTFSAMSHSLAVMMLAVVISMMAPSGAAAHAVGESYIFLHQSGDDFVGRVELAITDLQDKLQLSLPTRPSLTDLEQVAPQVQTYLADRFQVYAAGAKVELRFDTVDLLAVPQGSYAQFGFRFRAVGSRKLVFDYALFFDHDVRHRGLLLWQGGAKESELREENAALIFGPSSRRQTLDLDNITALPRVRTFVWQGVWHIWIGLDHVLFILILILPAVMRRDLASQSAQWRPVDEFSSALWNLLKVVSVFTLAHSLTLALAGLDFVSLPSRWVESLIAASIIVMAMFNIWPRINHFSLWLVFAFGLVHGLGFASVMGDLPFRTAVTSHLLAVVLAFNIGVELGQVAIVLAVFPLLYMARRWSAYRSAILASGSILCALIALPWLIERSLDINLGWSF